MKNKILSQTALALLLAVTARAQNYNYTTIDDPLGVNTFAQGISGNNIVGYYEDSSGNYNGFLYNGSTYTTLNNPLGVNGTFAIGIDGNNIVGEYVDGSGNANGFLYNGSSYTTLDDPLGVNYTIAEGVSGNNIVETIETALVIIMVFSTTAAVIRP